MVWLARVLRRTQSAEDLRAAVTVRHRAGFGAARHFRLSERRHDVAELIESRHRTVHRVVGCIDLKVRRYGSESHPKQSRSQLVTAHLIALHTWNDEGAFVGTRNGSSIEEPLQ